MVAVEEDEEDDEEGEEARRRWTDVKSNSPHLGEKNALTF